MKNSDEFMVRKFSVQNGRKVSSKITFEVVKKADPQPAVPVDDGFIDLMKCCVRDALEIPRSFVQICRRWLVICRDISVKPEVEFRENRYFLDGREL